MGNHRNEHYTELARHGCTHIDQCGCGMIYVGIGPATVKLSREAFAQLVRGVNLAEKALNRTSEPGQLLSIAPRIAEGAPSSEMD